MFKHTLIALTIAGCTLNGSITANNAITNAAYDLARNEKNSEGVYAILGILGMGATLLSGAIFEASEYKSISAAACTAFFAATTVYTLLEATTSFDRSQKLRALAHAIATLQPHYTVTADTVFANTVQIVV